MPPEIQNDVLNSVQPQPQPNKQSSKKKIVFVFFAILLLVAGIALWFFAPKSTDKAETNLDEKNIYLSNSNGVVCTVDVDKLNCEDLQGGELKEVSLPAEYKTSSFDASPDGEKLLITKNDGELLVTDLNFKVLRKVFSAGELGDERFPLLSWADGSKKLLISEVRREKGDLASLPAPFLVNMLDIETGEKERVYKTGEDVDVETMRVLGGNSTYIFVAYETPKNWVADSVDPPPPTVTGVRLSDGVVLPISANQVDAESLYYNSSNDTFYSFNQTGELSDKSEIIAANIEETEFGLSLKKTFELEADAVYLWPYNQPVISLKGLQLSNSTQQPAPFKFIEDSGSINEIALKSTKDNYIVSVKDFPANEK